MTPQKEPRLRTSLAEASEKLEQQIWKGEELLSRQSETDEDFEALTNDRKLWSDYTEQLLIRLFTTTLYAKQFTNTATASGSGVFDDLIEAERKHIKDKLSFLRSLVKRLELIDDESSDSRQVTAGTEKESRALSTLNSLHPEILDKCHTLLLTSYETGSDAFGKGNIYVRGAAVPNVDKDFNEGVKFLTMAIDRFRNEKSHTSDAKIDDPVRAYGYLALSSLALRLLDNAEIRTP